MNLTEIINGDIKAAMLAKEKEKLMAIRAIKAALLLESTKGGDGITEQDEIRILKKLHKQRLESSLIYRQQGRADLEEIENYQAEVISKYLPEQMSEEAILAEIKSTASQLNANSMADMGKLIGAVMQKLSGKADGKLISELVKKVLT